MRREYTRLLRGVLLGWRSMADCAALLCVDMDVTASNSEPSYVPFLPSYRVSFSSLPVFRLKVTAVSSQCHQKPIVATSDIPKTSPVHLLPRVYSNSNFRRVLHFKRTLLGKLEPMDPRIWARRQLQDPTGNRHFLKVNLPPRFIACHESIDRGSFSS
jgi:hypothetical protein